jgi:hypothetical protein
MQILAHAGPNAAVRKHQREVNVMEEPSDLVGNLPALVAPERQKRRLLVEGAIQFLPHCSPIHCEKLRQNSAFLF